MMIIVGELMKKGNFISGTTEYNTFEKHVPAPYIRKSFSSDVKTSAKIKIAACGFYEIYFNGKKITKGFLSPYINNTNHFIYYDEYEVLIDEGENVIGIILGNGFQNNPGGHIWKFDEASFRSAPMTLVEVTYKNSAGDVVSIVSDKSFKTTESPIRTDDYRFGEIYDANYELDGWNNKGFDDTSWRSVIEVTPPSGELKKCTASPILKENELKPKEIIETAEGYIYDFGVSNAGLCRLKIKGKKGQKIEIRYADAVQDGKLLIDAIWFPHHKWERDKDIVHKDVYICKGNGEEVYMPTFTYHGFRYAEIKGVDKTQVTEDLLTYVVFHSDIKTRGNFVCSDEITNTLQEMTRRSDLSNFHYFPTDCPQREKNGWTADAALSCEQMLLNFAPEKEYVEWICNICKAQNEEGALPGVIPTGGWGFKWGNGPAWDSVLAYLPYFTYIYCGETEMIYEAADSLIKYIKYLKKRADEKGLIHIGLGDWCHIGINSSEPAPLEVTDTVISMDIARKTAFMLGIIGRKEEQNFAETVANDFKQAIRTNLIDFDTMIVSGNCQTSQAMCIYYDVFEEHEKQKAFEHLLNFVYDVDEHMNVGVLGGRVIFHVLSKFGYSDLAFKMITRLDFPSYGNWIKRGATTLWENFLPDTVSSMNHHFWGDISAWFIKVISGININPNADNINHVEIKPHFIDKLEFAEGYHIANSGKIFSKWERTDGKIILTTEIPEKVTGRIILEDSFAFEDGTNVKNLKSGNFVIKTKLF